MRPTVADRFSAEEALGDQGRARWAVTRISPSSIVEGVRWRLSCDGFRYNATDIFGGEGGISTGWCFC